jgi:hypothetical protein
VQHPRPIPGIASISASVAVFDVDGCFIVAVSAPAVLAVGTAAGVGIAAAVEVIGFGRWQYPPLPQLYPLPCCRPSLHATATIEASNSFAGVMVKAGHREFSGWLSLAPGSAGCL